MRLKGFIAIALVLFLGISTVSAEKVPFSISTTGGKSWACDWDHPSIEDNNKYTGVKWMTTNQGSHKMWFGAVNESFIMKGSMLFDQPKSDAFLTNFADGEGAFLKARRENVGDPATTVTGYWLA